LIWNLKVLRSNSAERKINPNKFKWNWKVKRKQTRIQIANIKLQTTIGKLIIKIHRHKSGLFARQRQIRVIADLFKQRFEIKGIQNRTTDRNNRRPQKKLIKKKI
jgi:hypothetical protein